ncbi:YdeI/OmpD-associated family protein [Sandaracinobacteroides saxicola]|uniref:YdeI/OmpD-associated family protein n=1 Tax=Sandaracinobacteroides saxicola TaxID=2759707 RepID=A0A7G5IF10_9SPHN|nr:YdeI/OmpD-associated family protein [Sandaracinobacteroides saxicola]QMW21952.1 YdeI/OmpD-associated family protein [Sandaracinobacteroides saxicola]
MAAGSEPQIDPRIDAYIERAAPFAQPILRHIRETLHAALPGLAETIKWGMPFFEHGGKPLANMAAFKGHAAFGFWKREGAAPAGEKDNAMGQFGRLASLADLPPDAEIGALARAAAALIDAGATTAKWPKTRAPAPAMPADLAAALDAMPTARAAFDGFPPSAQREYLDWVTEAKAPTTRARRIEATVSQCAEGKRRYWQNRARAQSA